MRGTSFSFLRRVSRADSAASWFWLLSRLAPRRHRRKRSRFHLAGPRPKDRAQPVSWAGCCSEFLGDVLRALRGGNAIAGRNAAADEIEGRGSRSGQRRLGRKTLPPF